MKDLSIKQNRQYGIDLLRILSMFMIVALHVLEHGGVLNSCPQYSVNFYISWLLNTLAYCAVDLFAMISGYVLIRNEFNYFKIIPLWLNVFFYSFLIACIFHFLPNYNISIGKIIRGCFPILTKEYWYFTAYFGLFLFIPFLNKLLNNLTKIEHCMLCITIIILFSLSSLIFLKRFDSFGIGGGYNIQWLLCMYIIGAYIKLYPINLSKIKCIFIYLTSVFLAWLPKIIIPVFYNIFGIKLNIDLFIDYTSIFVISSAASLLLLFSKIEIKREISQQILLLISNLSFSVYLIHDNQWIRTFLIKNKFSYLVTKDFFLIKLLFSIICVFSICIFIDLFRYILFRLIRIHRIPKFIINKITLYKHDK